MQNLEESPTHSLLAHDKLPLPALPEAARVPLSNPQHTYQLYQQASHQNERIALLDELLARHAAPLAQAIVRKKLRPFVNDDALELQQQIHLKVLTRLRAEYEAPLQDFASYVAVVAYHTCAEWQRQRQPQRSALKNRLRYLLTHTEGLALWEAQPRVWYAGRTQWQMRQSAASGEQLEAARPALSHTNQLRELISALFAQLDRPVELDDLVNLCAEVLNIHDEVAALPHVMGLMDEHPSAEAVIERRAYLQKLWVEICALPVPQRCALLLNLRDAEGGSQLALFHLTGVAGFRQMAEALTMPLHDLLALWHQLPLDDLKLAARLGATRQQVINLRLAARRRLARHLGHP